MKKVNKYLEWYKNPGCMPFIMGIVEDNEGEKNMYHGYITIKQFRETYGEYANWLDCTYRRELVGEVSQELAKKIKNIIKYHYEFGDSRSNAETKIYGLINKDELPFPINEQDMKTAKILYDIYKNNL